MVVWIEIAGIVTISNFLAGMSRSNNKDPYNSKGPSMERNYKPQLYDGRGSRSGSQHRSAENSQRSTPTPVPNIPKPQPQAPGLPPPAAMAISEEQLKRRLKNILEEYLNECCTIEECNEELRQHNVSNALAQFVCDRYVNVGMFGMWTFSKRII